MTTYDKIWTAWLLGLIGSFAVFEANAIAHGHDTLSHFVWKTAKAWPLLGVSYGVLVGALAIHFFDPNEGLKSIVAKINE